MTCHNCRIEAKKFGKDRKGNQRYRCNQCSKTFQDHQEKPLALAIRAILNKIRIKKSLGPSSVTDYRQEVLYLRKLYAP